MNPSFGHENFHVYRVLLDFVRWATALIDEVSAAHPAKVRAVCDHLDRASLASLFGTAEGNGARVNHAVTGSLDKARVASMECATCLDAIVAKGACAEDRVKEGKEMLLRVVCMLTKLLNPSERIAVLREKEGEYKVRRPRRTGKRTGKTTRAAAGKEA